MRPNLEVSNMVIIIYPAMITQKVNLNEYILVKIYAQIYYDDFNFLIYPYHGCRENI
jgi:hypothetical protein